MNFRALLNTWSSTCRALPIVVLYVTEGCNLRCVTCSYRAPLENELTLPEVKELAVALKRLGLRHIVYSGGEPLMRRDLPEIMAALKNLGVRQTLLTNGLLLEKRLDEMSEFLSEIIVSIDGPTAEIHDGIRGAESFERIVRGVAAARALPGRLTLSIRTVVQRRNFFSISDMVIFARSLNVNRISFLAADVLSGAFGRAHLGPVESQASICLDAAETVEFRTLIERMIPRYADEFHSRFIADPPRHLLHIVEYFEALAGQTPYPRNLCNAPMVSAVITSTGDLLPCYFLPSYANVRGGDLRTLINAPNIRSTRTLVREYSLERCKTCVCTLHVGARAALLNRF